MSLLWQIHSQNAITLWNTKVETLKVEITNQHIKFFRHDDVFSCYTYPPLHILKKDDTFIKDIRDCMEEANMTNEIENMEQWLKTDCDLPTFPISVIFNSDYQNYTCRIYEENY